MRNQLVYDLPTRLFHWIFAGLFVGSFFIGKTVDDDSPLFSYHMLLGLTLAFLTVLRIVWGFVGTRYARFSEFPLNPGKLVKYFSDLVTARSERNLGHNPASSWAAIAMMLLALGLAVTGYLMSTGDKEAYEDIHELFANGFLIIAILHVVGVVVHTLKHKDMIGLSMIDGKKQEVSGESPIESARPVVGLVLLALVAGFWINLMKNYDSQTQTLNFFGTSLQLGENESEEHEGFNSKESNKDYAGEKDDDDDDDND
ncbi:MAG: cytochrome b/b6 domain-containing protein [Bdellovibrio sp.]|nr:cytochrome b/b6 domain-containing protein [Bdellovibrio sp.]